MTDTDASDPGPGLYLIYSPFQHRPIAAVYADSRAAADEHADGHDIRDPDSGARVDALVGNRPENHVNITAAAGRVRAALVDVLHKTVKSDMSVLVDDVLALAGPAPTAPVKAGDVLNGKAARAVPVETAASAEWTWHDRFYRQTVVRGPNGWVGTHDDVPFELADHARVTVLYVPDATP